MQPTGEEENHMQHMFSVVGDSGKQFVVRRSTQFI